ncbi:15644_t:CDS:2 [Cetraspora pellucida]|uniref:15644_t:CDS:1 n=1 Tax=Cetraspora pellucida TaxID=1433469 RepID=A0ACA9N4B9_9GLOM|nr:15644_t:CDS:2 [Cetraspora pellucida]
MGNSDPRRTNISSLYLDRRVNVNESFKKVKQDNPTGSGSSSSTTKSESISLKITTSFPVQQGKTGVPTVYISAPTNTQHPLSQSSTSITMTSPSANIDKEKLLIPTTQYSINQESTQDLLVRLTKKEEIQSLLDKNKTIESLQHELEGVKTLQDENEELGRQLRQGRVEQYEVEITLQRKMIYELKQGLEESDNQLISMDNEMERLQKLVFRLRAKAKLYEVMNIETRELTLKLVRWIRFNVSWPKLGLGVGKRCV